VPNQCNTRHLINTSNNFSLILIQFSLVYVNQKLTQKFIK
jgi:hypothetical protein